MPTKKKLATVAAYRASPLSSQDAPSHPINPNKDKLVPAAHVEEVTDKPSIETKSEVDSVAAVPHDRYNRKLYWTGSIVAGIVIGVTVGLTLVAIVKPQPTKPNPLDTVGRPTPTPEILPTPFSWSFDVKNGSGVAGAAGKAADTLRRLGYTVVSTGNAANRVTTTQLFVSSSVDREDVDDLLIALQSDFGISSVSGTIQGTTPSAQLIIGRK